MVLVAEGSAWEKNPRRRDKVGGGKLAIVQLPPPSVFRPPKHYQHQGSCISAPSILLALVLLAENHLLHPSISGLSDWHATSLSTGAPYALARYGSPHIAGRWYWLYGLTYFSFTTCLVSGLYV